MKFAGRRTKNHRDQQKSSGGRASSMKIAAISINKTLFAENIFTISDNSQERFSFLSCIRVVRIRIFFIIAAILPRGNQGGNPAGIYIDQGGDTLLFLMA